MREMKPSRDWIHSGWIAARYDDGLPGEMRLGDNMKPGTGEYLNRMLAPDMNYKVFVRAFNSGNVRLL